ncbi:MAG: hypothetical protein ACTSQZ_06745 [Candidatus Thorarchaeota archaeon]
MSKEMGLSEMKLEDVEAGKNVSELIVRIISVAPARMVSTRSGRKTQLKEVLIADETGSVILSLWGFKEGQDLSGGIIVKITDGWAKEWNGKIQLSLGRSGKYEVMSDDSLLPPTSALMNQQSEIDHRL